jgi:transcriptional regulator with XRE-family HTH domain
VSVEVRDLPVFARRLRFARERAGLSQRELGRRIGMKDDAASPRINQYESGTHVPRAETVEAIARALKIPVAYLFADGERMARMILAFAQLSAAEQERITRAIEGSLDAAAQRPRGR